MQSLILRRSKNKKLRSNGSYFSCSPSSIIRIKFSSTYSNNKFIQLTLRVQLLWCPMGSIYVQMFQHTSSIREVNGKPKPVWVGCYGLKKLYAWVWYSYALRVGLFFRVCSSTTTGIPYTLLTKSLQAARKQSQETPAITFLQFRHFHSPYRKIPGTTTQILPPTTIPML